MAASKIEDMTLGELSSRVEEMNGREDRIIEEEHRRIVKETTAKILALVPQPKVYSSPHPFKANKSGGCRACYYPEDHVVHRQV